MTFSVSHDCTCMMLEYSESFAKRSIASSAFISSMELHAAIAAVQIVAHLQDAVELDP
jgi:hypothetical protein